MQWNVDTSVDFDNAPCCVPWGCEHTGGYESPDTPVRFIVVTVCSCVKPPTDRWPAGTAVELHKVSINDLADFIGTPCYLLSADMNLKPVSDALRDDIITQMFLIPLFEMKKRMIDCQSCGAVHIVLSKSAEASAPCSCGVEVQCATIKWDVDYILPKTDVHGLYAVGDEFKPLRQDIVDYILFDEYCIKRIYAGPVFKTGIAEFPQCKVVVLDFAPSAMDRGVGSVVLVRPEVRYISLKRFNVNGAKLDRLTTVDVVHSNDGMLGWIQHGESRPHHYPNYGHQLSSRIYDGGEYKPMSLEQTNSVMLSVMDPYW